MAWGKVTVGCTPSHHGRGKCASIKRHRCSSLGKKSKREGGDMVSPASGERRGRPEIECERMNRPCSGARRSYRSRETDAGTLRIQVSRCTSLIIKAGEGRAHGCTCPRLPAEIDWSSSMTSLPKWKR